MSGDGTLAFDIETIDAPLPDGVDRDLTNSAHVELFCVCVGHRPAPGEPIDHEVFFRDGTDPAAELEVISRTVEWLAERGGDELLTYNGRSFDCPHLCERARIAAEACEDEPIETGYDVSEVGDGVPETGYDVADRAESLFRATEHVDLLERVHEPFRAVHGYRPPFERACDALEVPVERTPLTEYDFGDVDLAAHRSTVDATKPYLLGADVPTLGPRYLELADAGATATKTFRELEAMFAHYARTDVEPLFSLADRRPFDRAFAASSE